MYKYATTCVVGSWVLSRYDQPHPLLLIRLPWGGKMSQTYRRSLQSDRSDRVAASCRDRLLQPWFANGLFMTDAKSGCRVPVTLLHSPKQPRSDIGVKDQLVQSFWANTKSRVHKGWSNSKVWTFSTKAELLWNHHGYWLLREERLSIFNQVMIYKRPRIGQFDWLRADDRATKLVSPDDLLCSPASF